MYTQGDDDDDDDDDEWLGCTHYAGGTKREPLRTFAMPRCGKTLSVEQRPPQDGATLWESGSPESHPFAHGQLLGLRQALCPVDTS